MRDTNIKSNAIMSKGGWQTNHSDTTYKMLTSSLMTLSYCF